MKKLYGRLSLILVLAMAVMLLSSCGTETAVDLTDPTKPVIATRTYFSEEELDKDMGEVSGEGASGVTLYDYLKVDNPEIKFVDVTRDGVKYKYIEDAKYVKNTESDSAYAYVNETTGEEAVYYDNHLIYSGKKKAELYNYISYISDNSTSDIEFDSSLEFYDLSVKLPFKVYYTNGKKTGKKAVLFDKTFAESKERCVAVASKAIYEEKEITVKGVKNKKTYETGTKIKISSKNAIKVFTINDKNVAANSYTFNEAGTYKIRIVLANDTEKKLTIKIK